MRTLASIAVSMLFCAAAPGQLPPTYHLDARQGRVEVETTSHGTALHVIAIAGSPAAVTSPGGLLLSSTLAVGVVFAPEGVSTISAPAASPATLGLSAQVIHLDADGFVAAPILETDVLFGDNQADPQTPVSIDLGAIGELRQVRLAIEESQPPALLLSYVANSSDYDLRVSAVVRHAQQTDVYVVLKTPGPGEGLLDVVETHAQRVALGDDPGAVLRVYGVVKPGAAVYGLPLASYALMSERPLSPAQPR